MVQEKRTDETVFSTVLGAVKTAMSEWLNSDNQIRVMTDSESAYWAIIELDHCIGEIVVNEPAWTPYRFVKMEILPMDDRPPVFVWYDAAGDDAAAVGRQITAGLQAAMEYEYEAAQEKSIK